MSKELLTKVLVDDLDNQVHKESLPRPLRLQLLVLRLRLLLQVHHHFLDDHFCFKLLLQAALHPHSDGGGRDSDGSGDVEASCLQLPPHPQLPAQDHCQGPDQHLGQCQPGL